MVEYKENKKKMWDTTLIEWRVKPQSFQGMCIGTATVEAPQEIVPPFSPAVHSWGAAKEGNPVSQSWPHLGAVLSAFSPKGQHKDTRHPHLLSVSFWGAG